MTITHGSAPPGIAGDSNRVNLRPDGADFSRSTGVKKTVAAKSRRFRRHCSIRAGLAAGDVRFDRHAYNTAAVSTDLISIRSGKPET